MASIPQTQVAGLSSGAERIKKRPLSFESITEKASKSFCFFCAALSIVTTIGIVLVLTGESLFFFKKVSPLEFFFGTQWTPLYNPPQFGVLPLLSGTLLITLGAGLIALPIGLLAAVYLSEYASGRVRSILKPILEILAGVPTVVYGYFGLTIITPLLRKVFPSVEVFNGAAGAIVVGIMVLPMVCSLCEDAISSVPKALRHGGYALGATKLEVIVKVVIPAAFSGVMSAFILALSRAIGETMAVTLAAGNTPKLTLNPAESIQTMTSYIVQVSLGDTPAGSTAYQTIFAVGMSLFVITLMMNMLSVRLVKRFRSVYE